MTRLLGATFVLALALASAGCYDSGGTAAPTTTPPATTEQPPTTTGQPPATTRQPQGGDPAAGKLVFLSAGCTSCHTLAAAEATGTVGPNLDERKPSFDLAVDRVTNGKGVMPALGGSLTGQDINNVAAFVSQSAGQ